MSFITSPSGLLFHYSNIIRIPFASFRRRFSSYNPTGLHISIYLCSFLGLRSILAMRLAELMILLCLLSLALDSSDAAARMTMFLTATNGAKDRSSNETLEAVKRCKSMDLSKYEKYNNTSAEDKRVVPTGPNPLHNR